MRWCSGFNSLFPRQCRGYFRSFVPLFSLIVKSLQEVLPDVPSPEYEEALYGEVRQGDNGNPRGEYQLRQLGVRIHDEML